MQDSLSRGKLLISEPSIIGDESFSRSVVLITEYNDDGVVGFIMNKPSLFTLNELVPEIAREVTVYQGGPVDTDNLYFIHRRPDLIPESHPIENDFYWGGDFEMVSELLNTGRLENSEIRFFLGYSGWSTDQLENELLQNSWVLTNELHGNDLLDQDVKTIWQKSMVQLGGTYQLWSNSPENPQYN